MMSYDVSDIDLSDVDPGWYQIFWHIDKPEMVNIESYSDVYNLSAERKGNQTYPNVLNTPDFVVQIGPMGSPTPAIWFYVRKR